MSVPTLINLFCGGGGFSLGMERADFQCLAAIDFNPEAVATFRANFPKVPQVLEKDLTKFAPAKLASLIGTNHVDVIAGGPPCKGFSTARQRDGANQGDFLRLREGENCAEAMRRGVAFDFPYDRTTFKDRYTRQSRREACSTIVAHLSKDGLMFIHPPQNRSLTPRKAARVQRSKFFAGVDQ